MSSVDILADLGPSAEARAVARVLSAAAAPPWPHELRGYEAARRAFENAGAAPVRGGTHSAGTRAGTARAGVGVPLRRLIGVKLAAVAGALTVTGVAVAAEADVLPSPIQRAAHQVLGGVGVPDPDPGPRGEQTMASSPGTSGVPGSPGGPGSQGGLPGSPGSQGSHPGELLTPNSPGTDQASDGDSSSAGSLPGTPVGTADTPGQSAASTSAADALALCRAYVAHQGNGDANGNGNGNGKSGGGLNDHDRRRLAELAGGEDKISAYCAQVLAAASGAPIPQPTGGSTSPTATSTSPSASPDPSHDHKPAANSSSSALGFGPVSTSSQDGGGKHRRVARQPHAGS